MNKFVAVLNKGGDVTRLLNGLGHATAGLMKLRENQPGNTFVDYVDAGGNRYPSISADPFIILKGGANHMKAFRQALLERNIPHACFLDTMVEGGSEAQVARTLATSADAINILVIVTFGKKEEIDPLTKKFSLWS